MSDLGKLAKVIYHDVEQDDEYSISREYVEKFMNNVGFIVDESDAHGLCYGLVFPNFEGSVARAKNAETYWFEPNEIDILI